MPDVPVVQSTDVYDGIELGESPEDAVVREIREETGLNIAHPLTPQWVDMAELDTIIVGTTVDWRPVVKRALVYPFCS